MVGAAVSRRQDNLNYNIACFQILPVVALNFKEKVDFRKIKEQGVAEKPSVSNVRYR